MSEHTEQHTDFQQEAVRTQRLLTGVSRALDSSPILHQGSREQAVHQIVTSLKAQGVDFRVTDRGFVIPEQAGQPLSLQALVNDCLLLDKHLGDPQSIADAVAKGTIELGAKDELKTVQQKIEFIKKYGNAAWEKLPAHRQAPIPSDLSQITAAQLKTLPLKIKITMTEEQISAALKRR
jgi:hypothetical protein